MRTISFAATATTTALAAATAGVGLLVTAPGAGSADATKSSAYGIQVSGGGQEVVPPTPYVESTDGSTKTAGGGSLPSNPLGVAASIGELSAGDDEAAVELADLGRRPERRADARRGAGGPGRAPGRLRGAPEARTRGPADERSPPEPARCRCRPGVRPLRATC